MVSIALIICLIGVATLIAYPTNSTYFYFAIACIALSFGGTITVFPSLVSDFFGINNLTQNYGLIYLGFGIGSLIGLDYRFSFWRLRRNLQRDAGTADGLVSDVIKHTRAQSK